MSEKHKDFSYDWWYPDERARWGMTREQWVAISEEYSKAGKIDAVWLRDHPWECAVIRLLATICEELWLLRKNQP